VVQFVFDVRSVCVEPGVDDGRVQQGVSLGGPAWDLAQFAHGCPPVLKGSVGAFVCLQESIVVEFRFGEAGTKAVTT
jgi:hypothetical protein